MLGRRRNFVTLLIACAIGYFLPTYISNEITDFFELSRGQNDRRSLYAYRKVEDPYRKVEDPYRKVENPWITWVKETMVPVTKDPNGGEETALFWHIPKSGGTTIKTLYCYCMGLSLANRVGVDPKYGHHEDKEIVAFPVNDRLTAVNVDVLSEEGILRAKDLGLVASKKADIIVTSDIMSAGKHLFDAKHRGRLLALFRHPVDRLISTFYYMRGAYKADWKDMSLLEWSKNLNPEELNYEPNSIVRHLSNKKWPADVTETDVVGAVYLLKRRVIVGLTDQMEDSIRRFNIILGVDWKMDQAVHHCMREYFGNPGDKNKRDTVAPVETDWSMKDQTPKERQRNANHNPNYNSGSLVWTVLAEKNKYDIMLFENIVRIFDEQKTLFDLSP